MTGLDVLGRCEAYEREIERLRGQRAMALEAATRISPCVDENKVSPGGERTSPAERFAIASEWIGQRMGARLYLYSRELMEAVRLLAALPPSNARSLRLTMVDGLSVKEAAAEMRRSEDSVRGLLRRGRSMLASEHSSLGEDLEYQQQLRLFYRSTPPIQF